MSAAAEPSGYRLTFPSGWERVTTGEGSQDSVTRFIQSRSRTLSGSEKVFFEREMTAYLTTMLHEAQAAGALDLYAFNRVLRGFPVSMSFAVSVVFLGAMAAELDDAEFAQLAGLDAEQTDYVDTEAGRLFRALERRTVTVTETRELVAAQWHENPDLDSYAIDDPRVAAAVAEVARLEADGATRETVRVSYLAPIPDSLGAYLLLVFSTNTDQLSDAEIFHFDAVVSTLRWT